jgi:hypothetical protein
MKTMLTPRRSLVRAKNPLALALTSVLLLVAASTANATAVTPVPPPAIYSGTGFADIPGPGTYRYDEGAGNYAIVTFAAMPAPSITLNVVAGGTEPHQAFATDGITYFYHISGFDNGSHHVAAQIATTMHVESVGTVTSGYATLAGSDIADILVCSGNAGCISPYGSDSPGPCRNY